MLTLLNSASAKIRRLRIFVRRRRIFVRNRRISPNDFHFIETRLFSPTKILIILQICKYSVKKQHL